MIITKMALPRRTVLRGLGAAIALPLLDSMVPALTALAQTPANPVRRLGVVYIGMGAAPGYWTPEGESATAFELSPILEPLEPFKNRLVVVSGLDNEPAVTRIGEPGGGHGRISGAFLTGIHAKATEGADFQAGISIDQIAAAEIGQQTQLPSLEMQLDFTELSGSCDAGYSCAYQNTLCWRGPTTPLPMENDPRAVFERLFGDTGSTDPAVRLARVKSDRSVLDSVLERVRRVQSGLGPRDQSKLNEYLESVRDIEKRIQKAEAQGMRELPSVNQPVGIPDSWDEHAKLMFDLQVLAYQSDLTRVITFMLVREASQRVYPETGLPDPHHPLSHHQNEPENIAKLSKMNTYHVKLLAYYLNKLQSVADGEGSLLDNSLILYGGGMSNSNLHDPHDLPILLAGGCAGQVKGGRHLRYAPGTPLANLYLTMLHKVGVQAERVGNSTGELKELAEI